MPDILVDGELYEATDEALAKMAADGVKYELAPAAVSGGGFWEGLGDTLRGGAHGVSMGLADAKFGDEQRSLMQRLGGDDYSDVQARSPVLSTVGDVAGSIVSPAAKLGMAAKGASLLARGGRAALGSGVESLVRESAEGSSPTEALEAGGTGAAIGALIPGAGAAVKGLANTQLAQRAAGAVGDFVERGTNAARNRSVGLGANEMKALGKNTGLTGDQLQAKVAADIEALTPMQKGGMSADESHKLLEAERLKQGTEIGASLDEAGRTEGLDAFIGPSSGSQGTWANIQQRLQADASKLPNSTVPEQSMFNAAQSTVKGISNEAAPKSLGALHQRVSDWGQQAYSKGGDGVSSLADSNAAKSSEMAREVGRDELGQLIDNYATQETANRFKESMAGYARVADYARASGNRANIESASSNDLTGAAMTIGAALGQGALGAIGGGIAGGDIESAVGGGMAGIGLGISTAAHSGTNNTIKQALQGSRGQSALANRGRALTPKIRQAPTTLGNMGESLAAQGNRPGVVSVEGMVAPTMFSEDDDEDLY